MKRTLAALGFTALSLPALAAGLPYEQLEVDRALPAINVAPVAAQAIDERAPYEQVRVDRALPELQIAGREPLRYADASSGATRTDAVESTEGRSVSAWGNDHNFIAPAQ